MTNIHIAQYGTKIEMLKLKDDLKWREINYTYALVQYQLKLLLILLYSIRGVSHKEPIKKRKCNNKQTQEINLIKSTNV